jgi:hypothetical protein
VALVSEPAAAKQVLVEQADVFVKVRNEVHSNMRWLRSSQHCGRHWLCGCQQVATAWTKTGKGLWGLR